MIKHEISNNDLLKRCKNNPNYTQIAKERFDGALEGVTMYVFLDENTKEVIYLGDKLTKEQTPIFEFLLKKSSEDLDNGFKFDRTASYHG